MMCSVVTVSLNFCQDIAVLSTCQTFWVILWKVFIYLLFIWFILLDNSLPTRPVLIPIQQYSFLLRAKQTWLLIFSMESKFPLILFKDRCFSIILSAMISLQELTMFSVFGFIWLWSDQIHINERIVNIGFRSELMISSPMAGRP